MTMYKNIPVVYVAGPYRGPSEWAVTENIRAAEAAALELWKRGAAAVCPHKNTAYFGGARPDETWLEGDLAILMKCDALFLLPTWKQSTGAVAEVELARSFFIPIIDSMEEFDSWLAARRGGGGKAT
jgi:hypothetical protein